MKTYVYRMNSTLKRNDDGTADNTVAVWGFYVFITDNNELVDVAGPFDDEHDAEMAAKRAMEYAA